MGSSNSENKTVDLTLDPEALLKEKKEKMGAYDHRTNVFI